MACPVRFAFTRVVVLEDAIDPEEEPNELRGERVEVDEDGDGAEELRWNFPHEEERPTGNVTGRTWRLPCGCSEPRPQQVIRIADEVLAILAEVALENEQIDKAMEAMGVARREERDRRWY